MATSELQPKGNLFAQLNTKPPGMMSRLGNWWRRRKPDVELTPNVDLKRGRFARIDPPEPRELIPTDVIEEVVEEVVPPEQRRDRIQNLIDATLSDPRISRKETLFKLMEAAKGDLDEGVRRSAITGASKLFYATADATCCNFLARVLLDRARSSTERLVAYRALKRVATQISAKLPPSASLEEFLSRVDSAHRYNQQLEQVYSDDFSIDRDVDWKWVKSFTTTVTV